MKAIQITAFGGIDGLKYVELPVPTPVDDQVLIEVKASGVNFVDVRQRQGTYQRPETKVGSLRLPHIPGFQVVGVVKAVGPQGDRSLLEKRVLAMVPDGGYAQYTLARANLTFPLSPSVDDAHMAVLPNQGITAYLALCVSTRVRPGERVLVHAAGGGVGSLGVQIAKILGASQVIATAGTEEKRAFARSLGADVVTDYKKPGWTKEVLEATQGQGVDVLLESIGGEMFHQNFECLAPFGRYVLYGSTSGPGAPLEPRQLMQKAHALIGLYVPVYLGRPDIVHDGLHFLVNHVTQGHLKTQVDRVLPLKEAGLAHELLEQRRAVGTIILNPTLD